MRSGGRDVGRHREAGNGTTPEARDRDDARDGQDRPGDEQQPMRPGQHADQVPGMAVGHRQQHQERGDQ